MGHKYVEIAFTDQVKQVQIEQNSRMGYSSMEQGEDFNHLLSQREADFILARDSFYMASVSETHWPYVQHRGGPAGFLKVLDAQTIGFADFSGNRQYVSTGNFRNNDRVSLILMDYPNRARMKILGRISVVAEDDWETLALLEVANYRARVERGFKIQIEGFDWNCPQHITPRFTEAHVNNLLESLQQENQRLKDLQNLSTELDTSKSIKQFGNGPLPLVISGIRQLAPNVRAFELRDPDGNELPSVTAGSHIQLPVKLANGELIKRHYSICSNPARRDIYEVAILREDEGNGGSKTIHQTYQLGQRLHCDLPNNNFELDETLSPKVLIAGGIGITPLKAMAQSLKSSNIDFVLHYAGRSVKAMPFRDRLERELGIAMQVYSSEDNRRLDIAKLLSHAPKEAIFYLCGPNRLIEAVRKEAKLQGIPDERIRFERFASTIEKTAKPVVVKLQKSNREIEVEAEQSILDALLEQNVAIPFSCKTGVCRSCVVKVLDGEPQHNDSVLNDAEKKQERLMCPCVSRSSTPKLTLDL
jgi:ferredoxin-NADP reductase/predicted pyridoxine 5'-phosphate oxidase superfamily flavin-nucleotide-binding protein